MMSFPFQKRSFSQNKVVEGHLKKKNLLLLFLRVIFFFASRFVRNNSAVLRRRDRALQENSYQSCEFGSHKFEQVVFSKVDIKCSMRPEIRAALAKPGGADSEARRGEARRGEARRGEAAEWRRKCCVALPFREAEHGGK